MHELAERTLAGDQRALARAMRYVDDRLEVASQILKDVFPKTGRAYVIGVTGNPGAGKSTLTDRLIEGFRKEGKTVGVLCVDPSSPYSGGAILGDRIRMSRHSTDEGVFIRSIATRGHLGGLSRSARDLVRLLDAYGSDVILVETVGVGQDELEITRTAHTTLVVMAPGMGDEVQAIKAGLMECADVFAVNKADRDGADGTIRDVELMIALGSETMVASGRSRAHIVHGSSSGAIAKDDGSDFTPPVVRCVATRGEGMAELFAALAKHRNWLESTEMGRARRHQRLSEEVRDGLREALIEAAVHDLGPAIQLAVDAVEARRLDPYTATEQLIAQFRSA
ncbi:methylmalonyl Co-A mutase-associated GTPase MeaB [soil metagenome]